MKMGEKSRVSAGLLALLNLLLSWRSLMKLRFQDFVRLLAESLFHEPAGVTALRPREAFSLHFGLTIRSDDDFDGS
jgi:hypothetical protein